MADKKQKPKGIPLKSVFDDPHFQRHYEILLREEPRDQRLVNALTQELILQARVGNATNAQQTKKAQKPRPITNAEGEPLDNVIQALATSHPDATPGEIWPHLRDAIVEWSDNDCEEKKTDESNRDSWLYQFTKGDDTADSITYQSFRKKLADFEKKKRNR